MQNCLLIIDPQYDFCDPAGALFVPGANKDMERLSDFITKQSPMLDDIQITLDSHHYVHVAHPCSWKDGKGKHPDPFTLISRADVESGKWMAFNPGFKERYFEYVTTLEEHGRYVLCIWPPHCLIGSPGAAVYEPVFKALLLWEQQYAVVGKTTKGSNLFTEHYSAVKADVEDPEDETTRLNTRLVDLLKNYDNIFITGEALSHCVANTIRDIADEFSDNEVGKFTLLEDCSSNVPGFENLGEQFVKEMTARGMKVAKTTDF